MADAPDTRWGTIFMGPTPDRESTIDKVTADRQRELWNRRTEAEYMERVRVKATLRVQTMLDQARAQAEAIRGTARQWAEKLKTECEAQQEQAQKIRQDAEALLAQAEREREAGREEGYRIGGEQAFMELETHREALDDATASVLKTIEEQGTVLFEAWREDLAALTRDCVESLTGWVLTEEREAVLKALIEASVKELTDRRRLVIRVNPADYDAVTLVIESAKARHAEVKHWEVRADDSIEQAGLIVESASGMVDNRREVRRQAVDDILRHLTLPAGPADSEALAAVAREMEAAGINALAAQSEARAAALAEKEAEEQAAAEAARIATDLPPPVADTPSLTDAPEAAHAPAPMQEANDGVGPEPATESGLVPLSGPSPAEPSDLAELTELAESPDLADLTDLADTAAPEAPREDAPPAPQTGPSENDAPFPSSPESPSETADALPPLEEDNAGPEDDIPILNVVIADARPEEAEPAAAHAAEMGGPQEASHGA